MHADEYYEGVMAEAVKEQAAATTLVMPLFAVKNTHVRAMLDAALVTDAWVG
jgi:hypothetical protein